MERLVECVPNFSEGRNRETVSALVETVRGVAGVVLLDEEMDADHHRAVLTFAGPPEAVAEAAFRATRVAAERIDLRRHQGGHPRVGATDVVPFVPIRGVTMDDCVALARRVGERIGRELGIPVFLYERAATHPERVGLEVIRKGGLEGLARRLAEEPAWAPDFGPRLLHPTAGATVVGARPPLIAYNVNLATTDLAVANAIAKTVRFSSGGLPAVKAIGVELASRRQVQVSMNLTDYEVTPIHVAFEAVTREAERRGLRIAGSEIIGLVPQRALIRVAEQALRLEGFDPSQVLEVRLEQALARQARAEAAETGSRPGLPPLDLGSSLSPFLAALSAGTPTPGAAVPPPWPAPGRGARRHGLPDRAPGVRAGLRSGSARARPCGTTARLPAGPTPTSGCGGRRGLRRGRPGLSPAQNGPAPAGCDCHQPPGGDGGALGDSQLGPRGGDPPARPGSEGEAIRRVGSEGRTLPGHRGDSGGDRECRGEPKIH